MQLPRWLYYMNKLTGLVLPVLQRFKNSNPLKHFLLWQENKVNTGIVLRAYSAEYDTKFIDFMQLETFILNSISPCHLTGSLTCWDKEELWKKILTCWQVSNMHVHTYGKSSNCIMCHSPWIIPSCISLAAAVKCSISKLSVRGEFSIHSVVSIGWFQWTKTALTPIGYLLEVFIRLWIPSLVCISTSAWSTRNLCQSFFDTLSGGFMTLTIHPLISELSMSRGLWPGNAPPD